MTVKHHDVEGFDNAKNLINDLESKNEVVFVLFSGAKNADGASWCPDCEKAEPVIDKFLTENKFKNDFNFIHVGIERTLWKDMACQYRTDPKFKLERIPTLIKWGGPEVLKEGDCANKEMLELLFEDA